MDGVTKRAIENLRELARVYRTGVNHEVGPSCLRAAEIIDAACRREEDAAIGSEIIGTLTIPDPRTDFRERVILAMIERGNLTVPPVTKDEEVPAASELYGKVLVGVADAIVSAAYPQPKKETA